MPREMFLGHSGDQKVVGQWGLGLKSGQWGSAVGVVFGACLAFHGAILAAGKPAITTPRITGIYSDMQQDRQELDISGMEIFIVLTENGHHGVIQFAEGMPLVPLVVPLEVSGRKIRFNITKPNGGVGSFSGEITPTGIRGRFSGSGETIFLRKGKSYWQ